MPQPLLAPPFRPRRIAVEEYHRMLDVGILKDCDPVELLDGMLVYKDRSARGEDPMSLGRRHVMAVNMLSDLNPAVRKHRCHLLAQAPITLAPNDEPEPDGAVVRGKLTDYPNDHPTAADVFAMIEVSDSSLQQDRTRKARLYATAGIPQYVIVNLVDDRIEVFTQPRVKLGKYAHVAHLKAGASLSLNCGPGKRVLVPVRDLLP